MYLEGFGNELGVQDGARRVREGVRGAGKELESFGKQ